MFTIFINDVAAEINNLDLGIQIDNKKVSILLYADDIALIASSDNDLQRMLDILWGWCRRWRVLINTSKSKCIHFRPFRHRRTEFQFKIGQSALETVDTYKYLGVFFHEHLDYSTHCDAISKGASRALGSIISKISNLKDFGFKSFEKLYFSCVVLVL